jgi:hypothetical protein
MTLTVTSIITFVTLIIGSISKKYNLINKKYIPIQNIVIGLISGVIAYLTGLESNFFSAITICLISSLSAGGIYDTIKIRKDENIENKS